MMKRICAIVLVVTALVAFLSNGAAHAHLSVGNIDDSYAVERVTVSRDGRVYAWDRTGEVIEGWPIAFAGEGYGVSLSPRLVDVTRDGRLEIVLVLRGASGAQQMRVLRGDGVELASWRFPIPGTSALVAAPIIADINEDSRLEVAFATAAGAVSVYRRSAGFVKLDAFDADMGAMPWLITADPDNDGRVQLYGVDREGRELVRWESDGSRHLLFTLDTDVSFQGGVGSIDVDGDGRKEILVGTSAPELIALDAEGDLVRRYPLAVAPAGRPMIADIDLDMEPEVIVLLADRSVHAVHPDGTRVRRWSWRMPYEAGDALDTGVVAFDLYEGLLTSVSGWDQTAVYKVSRERFVELTLGENVHVYDRVLAEMEMPITRIEDVAVLPKLITPNGDGHNEEAEIRYLLSTEAAVTVDLLDAAGNRIYRVAEDERQAEGRNAIAIDGVNTQGTVTENDDVALPKGLYFVQLSATNDLGLTSRVNAPLIVFGVRAEIDAPIDADEEDERYPTVHGMVGIRGIATDPNIGEGNDNFDFLAYKVYVRPGAWLVDEDEALHAGDAGSAWSGVPVPIQHQSPDDVAREPADDAYPSANVSVRPVQHGLLAHWDASDMAVTPNGLYTILLKVIDGSGNVPERISFDSVVVQVRNVAPGTPYDPNDPATDPTDPENVGPVLTGLSVQPARITTTDPQSEIAYTLQNETSDISIALYRADGGEVGPVVASFAMGASAPGAYHFTWNGKDNLNRRVDVGRYRARITASAVDGTGGDVATTEDIRMDVATEYNTGLALLSFALSSDVFDPFDFITDENGQDVLAEELSIAYQFNRYARLFIDIVDGDGEVVRTITNGIIDKEGIVSWNGADDRGRVVASGRDFTVRIRGECIDTGCTDLVEDSAGVEVRALAIGGGGLAADISMLIGDEQVSGDTPDQRAGILRDDADVLNDFPLNGSADFSWRAAGKGYVRVPFTYEIEARGTEEWYEDEYKETTVTPENVPLFKVYYDQNPYPGQANVCTQWEHQMAQNYTTTAGLSFTDGFQIKQYGVKSLSIPGAIQLEVTGSDGYSQMHEGPFEFTQSVDSGASVNVTFRLQGRPKGALSSADQQIIMNGCTRGTNLAPCTAMGYAQNPTTSPRPFEGCDRGNPQGYTTQQYCASWPEWTAPTFGGAGAIVSVTCGSVKLWADARKQGTRPWGWFASSGSGFIDSRQYPGSMYTSAYSGATSSGGSNIISSQVDDYKLTFTPRINGENHERSSGDGYLNIDGLIQGWLGSASAPGAGGQMYVDILPAQFQTGDDTNLASNPCLFDGVKYINGTRDTGVQTAAKRCIVGSVEDVNSDAFRLETDPFSVYAAYPIANHPLFYSFSDVVHINEWTIDLRYPDGSVNDAFDVIDLLVHSDGTRDVNGDGVTESNKNVEDRFALRLKPDAAPKRLIEIRGQVVGTRWELRFFDAGANAWRRIAEGNGARSGTLAWWDVSRLNGRSFTVVLRTYDDADAVASEDTMDVDIGTPVHMGEYSVVRSPYGRYAIHFDENSLCPEEGPYPCDSGAEELVTVTPVPMDTPGFYLPSGIAPVGPVIEIKPDDIELNPIYQPQLEVFFTRAEIETLYAQEPQDVRDYVYGITAADVPVMALYNLKEDGELEQLATINTWDDQGTPGTGDDLFRISGLLNHFSRYLVMREDDGYPRLTLDAPGENAVVNGDVHVAGSVSGVDDDDPIDSLVVTVSDEEDHEETIFSGTSDVFDFSWNSDGADGARWIRAVARTNSGQQAEAAVSVVVDNAAPHTQIVVNEQLVEPGALAVVPPESELMLVVEDATERADAIRTISFRWDEGDYQEYEGIIALEALSPGRHAFSCFSEDDQGNQEAVQTVFISIVDPDQPGGGSTSVETLLSVGEPHADNGHEITVGPETPIAIVAAEGSSETHQIRYRINDEDYQVYSAPVTLGVNSEGVYEIEFFGIDFFGLAESAHAQPLVLDSTAPTSTIEVLGSSAEAAGRILATDATQFSCAAEDGGLVPAGVDRIEYRIDEGDWTRYEQPFGIAREGRDEVVLAVRAVDRVGNAEMPTERIIAYDVPKPQLLLVEETPAFSPNADGRQDEAVYHIRVTSAFGGALQATLHIADVEVDRFEGEANEIVLRWDGRFGEHEAADGVYAYRIDVSDGASVAATPLVGEIRVDTLAPAVAVTGVAREGNGVRISYETTDHGAPQAMAARFSLFAGEQEVVALPQSIVTPPNDHAFLWDGLNRFRARALDGGYRYAFTVADAAGNVSVADTGELSLDAGAPTSRLVVMGPTLEQAQERWVGPTTRMLIAASDLAGSIGRIEYRLDGSEWQAYAESFGLAVPGVHDLDHRAVDSAGNEEEPKAHRLILDDVPPVSQLQVEGIEQRVDGVPHWSGTATLVNLQASDAGSGVAHSYMRLESPPVQYDLSAPRALGNIGDGEHVARFWSQDAVGNTESEQEVRFVLHAVPPWTSVDIGSPQYRRGRQIFIDRTTPIQVRAESNVPDVVYLEHRLDGAGRVTVFSEGVAELAAPSFRIADAGGHAIRYLAIDQFENREERELSVTVDNNAPSSTLELSQQAAGEDQLVTPSTAVRLSASDDIVGVSTVEYAIDDGTWESYETPFELRDLAPGAHVISHRSTDYLGHIESSRERHVELLDIEGSLARKDDPRILVLSFTDDTTSDAEVAELRRLAENHAWGFRAVQDLVSFQRGMRSDAFNVFVFNSPNGTHEIESTAFNNQVLRELAARIYKGDVLMLTASAFAIEGVEWTRMLDRVGGVQTATLDASDDGPIEMIANVAGKEYVSAPLSSNIRSFSGISSLCSHVGGDTVVGSREYGDGSLLFVGVNLKVWADSFVPDEKDGDGEDLTRHAGEFEANWDTMWEEIFAQLVQTEESLSPGEVISLVISAAASDRAAQVRLLPGIPSGMSFVGSDGDDSHRSESWIFDLTPGVRREAVYTLRMPATGDAVRILLTRQTSWYNGLSDTTVISFFQEVGPTWADLWQRCAEGLAALRDAHDLPPEASAFLEGLIGRWESARGEPSHEVRLLIVLDTMDALSVLDRSRVKTLYRDLAELVEALQAASFELDVEDVAMDVSVVDADGDGLSDDTENDAGTDPYDADTDDDGVLDGQEIAALEDSDGDGFINALDTDSDGDGLADGLEFGLTEPAVDPDGFGPIKATDEDSEAFVADEDSQTTTNMASADTDGGGLKDGEEDRNANGRVDSGETDPNDPLDDTNPTQFAGGGGGAGCSLCEDGRSVSGVMWLCLFGLILGVFVLRRANIRGRNSC